MHNTEGKFQEGSVFLTFVTMKHWTIEEKDSQFQMDQTTEREFFSANDRGIDWERDGEACIWIEMGNHF